MEKKRIFDAPELIVITFNNDDVIRASGPNDEEDPNKEWDF